MRKMLQWLRARRIALGFTLLELLVVLMILGVIIAFAVPSWLAFLERRKLSNESHRVAELVILAQSESSTQKINVNCAINSPGSGFNLRCRTVDNKQVVESFKGSSIPVLKDSCQIGSFQPKRWKTSRIFVPYVEFNFNGGKALNERGEIRQYSVAFWRKGVNHCQVVDQTTIVGKAQIYKLP